MLEARSECVIRVSIDDFHAPAEKRYARGRHSPGGFYRDSYDYDRFRALLLDPLSPGGNRRFRRAIYDVARELPVTAADETAQDGAILIVDGIFLHRDELAPYWDYSVYLDVRFDVSVPRGASRGYGSPDPDAPENRRYVDGQRLYQAERSPKKARVDRHRQQRSREPVRGVSMNVRRAEIIDAVAIARLMPHWVTSARSTKCERASRSCPAATATRYSSRIGDGRIAGVASIHLVPMFHAAGSIARLTALVVDQSVRRSGVGAALVRAAEAFGTAGGCERMELTSGDHRTEAHRFYETIGYQRVSQRFIKPL